MMTGNRGTLILFVAALIVGHFLTVQMIPGMIMSIALDKVTEGAAAARGLEQAEVYNQVLASQLVTAKARTVVRPSPDLMYSVCVFDLSRGPLTIAAPTGSSYMSVSGFADNTDNFFARNDQDAVQEDGGSYIRATLVAPGHEAADHEIVAPSMTGLVLFRMLIPSVADIPGLQALQKRQICQQG